MLPYSTYIFVVFVCLFRLLCVRESPIFRVRSLRFFLSAKNATRGPQSFKFGLGGRFPKKTLPRKMQFLAVFRACFSADKFPGWIRTVTNPILVVSFFDGSGSESPGATASTPKYICYQIVLATKFSFHKKEKYERVKGKYGKKQKN